MRSGVWGASTEQAYGVGGSMPCRLALLVEKTRPCRPEPALGGAVGGGCPLETLGAVRMSQRIPFVLLLLAPLCVACGGGSGGGDAPSDPVPSGPQLVTRAVVPSSLGTAGEAEATAISGDGAVVACVDSSGNAVLGDTNDVDDVLVSFLDGRPSIHVSVAPDGSPGNSRSNQPQLDQDGSHCAFVSLADNLVPNDTNGAGDVFVRDITAGTTRRVSVTSSGEQVALGGQGLTSISADGRVVAFVSSSDELVAGDTNGLQDIFVHDVSTGTTTRVNVTSAGAEAQGGLSAAPHLSGDGRFVVFESRATNLVAGDTNGEPDIFLHDRTMGTTTRVSVDAAGVQADGYSEAPRISDDGNVIVYRSSATNLLGAGNDTNGRYDIFVYVVASGAVSRVSVDSTGAEGNSSSGGPDIDATGRFVVFVSGASNLVPEDTNDEDDIFVHDSQTGITERVNTRSGEPQSDADRGKDPAISDDGRQVAFAQAGHGLTPDGRGFPGGGNVFRKDLDSGALVLSSRSAVRDVADGNSGSRDTYLSVSANGRWVVFVSEAGNLVSGDDNCLADLFRHDRQTGATVRVIPHPGVGSEQSIQEPSISDDGRFICFVSRSPEFLAGGVDTNGREDVFVHDVLLGLTERVSVHTDGTQSDRDSDSARMSADGRFVVFISGSARLADTKTGTVNEVFLRDRQAGTTSRVVRDRNGNFASARCEAPDVSDDGRYISFHASSAVFVAGDTNGRDDVFVQDVQTGAIRRASISSAGVQGTGDSSDARISADGRYVVFESRASDLVDNDTNSATDVFRHDLQTGETLRVSVSSLDMEATGSSVRASISSDGAYVLFFSRADNLASAPIPDNGALFVRHLPTGQTRLVGLHPDGGIPTTSSGTGSRVEDISADGQTVVYAYNVRQLYQVYWIRSSDGLE